MALVLLKKYQKTAAMAAVGYLGDNQLFLINYLLRFLRVLLLLAIWRTILAGKGSVSGMTLASVLTYTLIAEAFAYVMECRTWLEGAFWNGSIATRFLRPMGVFAQFAAEMFGPIIVGLMLFSLPLFVAAPLLGVNPLPASTAAGGLFVVSLILAVSVGLAIEYVFAGAAIALQVHPYVLNNVRVAIGSLLSGALLPLALLPWGLGRVFGWLPFASQASAPLRIYTGTGSPLFLMALQVVWSLILWPLAVLLWRVNRERMVAYGG